MILYQVFHDLDSWIQIAIGIVDLSDVADKPTYIVITFLWLILVENLRFLVLFEVYIDFIVIACIRI